MARTTVDAQLAKIRKAKEALEKKEKALLNRTQGKILEKIIQLAKANGITAAQIAEALKSDKPRSAAMKKEKAKTTRAKVAPKYRNPANAQETWTGRGRSPVWVKALQDAGQLDTAVIK